MAYTFPLSTADFWDLLPIQSLTFDPVEQLELSETGGGEFIAHDLGPQLWSGRVSLGKMTPSEARLIMPMLNLLRSGGRSFLAWDRRRPEGPTADPDGTVLGAAAPKIVTGAGRSVVLFDLPPGYAFQRGDLMAVQASYGRLLLQIVTPSVVADGSGWAGLSGAIEVVPSIPVPLVAGTAVTLIRPACKCMIRPQSINPGLSFRGHVEGVEFEFQQVMG